MICRSHRSLTDLALRAALASALASAAVLASAAAIGAKPDARAEPLRVLFVGNSLTATNDLPARVAALGRAAGREIETDSVVGSGFSLEDHWNAGEAVKEIAAGDWDVVVLQQGPSSLPESQAHLRLWSQRFAAVARRAGARPGLLTVWPESYRKSALGAVIASYSKAAKSAGAELFPAGDAWRRAWACDRRVALYGADGFHPSELGTYLAALVVYGRLFKSPVVGKALEADDVAPRTARMLQSSAALALGRKIPAARRCG